MDRQCRQMTAHCYPQQMTVEEFVEEVWRGLTPFRDNMLKIDAKGRKMWPEDWIQRFAAWSEMEKGDFTD